MRIATLLLLAALSSTPCLAQTQPEVLPRALFDTMSAGNGRVYPGYRVNHAKGVLYEGMFTPSSGAAALSAAPHLQQTASALLLRFSNAGGVPDAPDTAPSSAIRGLAFT